jgi:hypothetical protein
LNATNLVYRKEQLLAPVAAHVGQNAVFNRTEEDKQRMLMR